MSTLLCVNRKSRSGDAEIEPCVEKLRELGAVEIHFLEDGAEPVADAAHRMGEALERIVIGGGDGTLNQVLPDLCKIDVPIGVLPLGTANDFARSIDLPMKPEQALGAVLKQNTRKVDIGLANGRPFLNAAGIGLGPELTETMDEERKNRFGVLAYLVSFLQVIRHRWQRPAVLEMDGERLTTRFMQITIVNGIHYGGGMTIAEDARVHDGKLRVLLLPPQSVWSLVGQALTLRRGVPRNDDTPERMKYFTAEKVSIKTRRPFEVTLDGEFGTRTPLECEVLTGALEVYYHPDALDEEQS